MDGYNLSPDLAAFVEHEVATGHYADANEYLSKLVDTAARQKLEQLLMEGVYSEELAWTPELLQQIRRDAHLSG